MSFSSIGEVKLAVGDPSRAEADIVVLGIHEGADPTAVTEALDKAAGGALRRAIETKDFKGEANEALLLYPTQGPARRILLVGLGKQAGLTRERIRSSAATAARRCRDLGVARACAFLFGQGTEISAEEAAEAFVEGALLGTFQYVEFKTKDREKIKTLGTLEILVPDERIRSAAEGGFSRARAVGLAVNYVRTLAAHPGNHATPSFLAAEAERLAADPARSLRCTIFDRAKMKDLGMGALLGVAKGSHEEPRFILLEYSAGDPGASTVAVVGKGLTFDAGGISIKPSAKMEDMKFDMCGGAAVLGIMSVLKEAGVKVNVVGAVPATENLPGGGAYKPGDILRSYSGKTIEIQNCDAEGRLILADALSYVARVHKPAAIVDMATLTGAVVIALGHYGAGLLSNDEPLAARIEDASKRSGDRLWRLPIWEEMNDHLKSDFADLKNIGDASAGGGTIIGGAFLGNFVDGIPWAHIDIAGTAYWEKDRPHLPKGPSGYGVRLIVDLLRHWGG
ncbi:MAG: leucyl aminopeptidase [Candidatus Eisenbacteria bacterium]|nr:leucyl aminopeptidase [Candidatus Eisenbacteria bacterium]